jgi:mono/diheme cytochrome c family protein
MSLSRVIIPSEVTTSCFSYSLKEEETMKTKRVLKLPLASAALALAALGLLTPSTSALTGGSPNRAADGAALFRGKCALCHGENGAGLPSWKAKGQPDFTNADWQKSRTDAQITETVKNGKGKYMPAFKAKLSDEEIAALTAQVRAFGKK